MPESVRLEDVRFLHEAVLFHEGITKADLATAAAATPRWLVLDHPDTLHLDRDEVTLYLHGR